jgi:hypothetical protein
MRSNNSKRGKWRFWHGYTKRGIIGLVELKQWAGAKCFEHIPSLAKLKHALCDMICYAELNADSMPNYGNVTVAASESQPGSSSLPSTRSLRNVW